MICKAVRAATSRQTFTSAANVTYVDVSVFPYVWNWQVLIGLDNVIRLASEFAGLGAEKRKRDKLVRHHKRRHQLSARK